VNTKKRSRISTHPRKRQIQEYFGSQLQSWVAEYSELKGTIAILPGPWEPIQVVTNALRSPAAIEVVGFEQDLNVYQEIRRSLLRSHSDVSEFARKSFFNADIQLSALVHSEFWKHWDMVPGAPEDVCWRASGVDYDMCAALNDNEVSKVIRMCEAMQYNKTPYWFRLTCCSRCVSADAQQARLNQIQKRVANLGHTHLAAWETKSYRDTMTMSCTQFLCLPEKSFCGHKTLSDLSIQERDMLKTLMSDVVIRGDRARYTEEDLRLRFNLSRACTGKLKSNITIRENTYV
jgi:hypothetical protein